jgi:hypothetical protein
MCAGVPSVKGSFKLLERMQVSASEISSFRYRGDGWPGFACASLKKGRNVKLSYNESWGKVLNQYLQHRCKICVDGIGESADIVFADAWSGGSNGYTDFTERDGRSLFISRTHLGDRNFIGAIESGHLERDVFDLSTLAHIQPFQYYRKVTALSRLLGHKIIFWKVTRIKNMSIFKLFLKGGSTNIKAFIGSLQRAFRSARTSD